MRQYAGFGTARETNRRFRQLLAAGQSGLSTAFDLPTQMGYDSDHEMAHGEVGRVGVAIDTVDDLADLFREIPLDRVSTSMTINATAAILLAMYVVVGEEQGVPRTKLTGTVQNDVLKEYVARGTYIYPAAPFAAAGGRHLPLRGGRGDELQSDLDQWLPHARSRSDGGPGGRVHAGQRAGVRAGGGGGGARGGQLRPPALVLLRQPQRSLRGGGQVPGRAPALGPTGARAVRRGRRDRAGFASTPRPAASRSRPSSRSTTWCG